MVNGERPPLNPKTANAVVEQLGRRLDSWKEIASWFNRSEKTVRRWEEREEMPVHRLLHEKRGTVYAYSAELEAWRESRKANEPTSPDLTGGQSAQPTASELLPADQGQEVVPMAPVALPGNLKANGLTQAADKNPREPAIRGGDNSVGSPFVCPVEVSEEPGSLSVLNAPNFWSGNGFAKAPQELGAAGAPSGSLKPLANGGAGKPKIERQPHDGGWLSRRRLWLMLAATGALSLAAFASFAWYRIIMHRSVAEEPHIGSVAVLPLTDLGADYREDYFADGMTEELITGLGRLSSIRIISRTSIMQFKKSARSLPEIGRQLNVDALVEGTVRRSGDRVRITVRLVGTSPERLIWEKAYEGDMRDVLTLQSDVAQDIAGNIQAKLDQPRVPNPRPNRRLDPQAYEEYLRGRYFLARRDTKAMNEAVGCFQRAVQRDPRYAQAYAGLAVTYVLLGGYSILSPEASFPPAIEYANKALELDGSVSEAYTARAMATSFYKLDWAAAERDFQRAIALDPSSALAHHWYGEHFTNVGKAERAVSELKLASELDPLSLPINNTLGRTYRDAHHYDEAVQQCKDTLKLDPNFSMGHWCLAQAYTGKKQYSAAVSELELASVLGTTPLLICDLGCAYAAVGKKTEARAILKGLQKQAQLTYVSPYLIASIYSALDEKDKAFEWLEKAYDQRDRITWLPLDPQMDPLRSDPRFVSLIQRLHLPR